MHIRLLPTSYHIARLKHITASFARRYNLLHFTATKMHGYAQRHHARRAKCRLTLKSRHTRGANVTHDAALFSFDMADAAVVRVKLMSKTFLFFLGSIHPAFFVPYTPYES